MSITLTASCLTSAIGFAPPCPIISNRNLNFQPLHAVNANKIISVIQKNVKGAAAATILAGAIWASPAAILGSNNIDNSLFNQIQSSVVVDAKEMASGLGEK